MRRPEQSPRQNSRPTPPRRPDDGPPHRALPVVWEDGELFVIDKPAGLPCVAPRGESPWRGRSLVDQLAERVRRQHGGRPRAWVGQRPDDEASGLVLAATTARAHEWLFAAGRSEGVQRFSLALVEGRLGGVGSIQRLIFDEGEGPVRVLEEGESARAQRGAGRRGESRPPRRVTTHYKVLAANDSYSLLRVRAEGDCRHQVRAHLASIGHPVAGDRAYGAQTDPLGRVLVHTAELSFTHPQGGRPVRVRADGPPEMWSLAGEGRQPAPRATPSGAPEPGRPAAASSWDEVAGWYDELVEDRRNDLLREVVEPGVLGLLGGCRGARVLDLACGQGFLARTLADRGAEVWGVDASPRLIDAARVRSGAADRFAVADATRLGLVAPGFWPGVGFDAVVCVMALMNMEPLGAVVGGAAARLRPGGCFVAAILHPAFRIPGQTAWGWDERGEGVCQYRRVDSYLSAQRREIVMNPGEVSRGATPVVTWTFHRPLGEYVRALGAHGLRIEAMEEWVSPRESEPGPRAAAENLARREIPMFLGLRAVKLGASRSDPASHPAG